MDDLKTILSNKNFDEPDEIGAIKNYVQNNFQTDINVLVRDQAIVISSHSAGLIATLRMRSPELARLCQTNKKLVFRIG